MVLTIIWIDILIKLCDLLTSQTTLAPIVLEDILVQRLTVKLGLAIYDKISLMNHSCVPNVHVTFDGRIATVLCGVGS